MTDNDTSQDNPFTTDAWRGKGSASWLEQADRLEAMLDPVLDPLFDAAALAPPEAVLDVGCGRGVTTRAAAAIVGTTGRVTAVDVAPDLIEAAAARAVPDGAAPIEWLVADAQRAPFADGSFDAVISRFGVMFFDDAVAAFANLRRAVRPGGRLAVCTWRPRDASPFQHAGYDAIVTALTAAGYDIAAGDPTAGPYAFGVDSYVHEVLGAAGWHDIVLTPLEMPLYFAGPETSPLDAVGVALGMHGTRAMLAPFDDRARDIAHDALLHAYERHHDGSGVRLDAAMVLITATG
jgi:SAM-dependent methyltransferase